MMVYSNAKKINGDTMEQQRKTGELVNAEKTYTVKNYCVNTNRTYIYEIKNGEIINERKVQGEE